MAYHIFGQGMYISRLFHSTCLIAPKPRHSLAHSPLCGSMLASMRTASGSGGVIIQLLSLVFLVSYRLRSFSSLCLTRDRVFELLPTDRKHGVARLAFCHDDSQLIPRGGKIVIGLVSEADLHYMDSAMRCTQQCMIFCLYAANRAKAQWQHQHNAHSR